MSFLYIPWWSQPITGAVTDGVLFINGTTRTVTTNSSLTFDGIDLRLATIGSVYAGQYELLDNAPFIPQYALFRDGISIGFSTEGNQRLYINRSGITSPSGGFTATSANPILNFLGEFNTGSVATGFRLNITDTASAAASLLMDLQVGGVSRVSVNKSGNVTINSNANPSVGYSFGGAGAFVTLYKVGSGGAIAFTGGANTFFDQDAIGIGSNAVIARDAANTLAQRNGVNAQTLRVYNTFTDASNYERGRFAWVSNALRIGTEFAGTGSSRDLEVYGANIFFNAGNAFRWYVSANGPFLPYVDNSFDIGSNANRARNVFVAEFQQMYEMTAPAAPAANSVRIYAEDNGSGKTRLMALFATGAAQQIAIEP